jgi:putative component of toxin-antitoxin plasmid stabilization module
MPVAQGIERLTLDHGIGVRIAVQRRRELRLTGRSLPLSRIP